MEGRLRSALLCTLALALAVPACTASRARPAVAPPPPAPSPEPPPTVAAPLTGKQVPAVSAFLERPALAVKVENSRRARPQTGLDRADVVYEELVEGGSTRFIAIFHSRHADPLGPVRSARPEDPDILREYRALFGYSGAAFYVKRLIKQTPDLGSVRHGEAAQAYYRDRSRRAPHNLYTSTKALYRAGRKHGMPPARAAFEYSETPQVAYRDDAPAAAPTPAAPLRGKTAVVGFSSPPNEVTWRYDPATNTYLRFQAGEPHLLSNGKQVSARNVLVMRVRVKSAAGLDAGHASTPISIMTGSGRAILLRDRLRVPGRWERPGLDERTEFATDDGAPLLLAPGNTWIELVPSGRRVRVV